MAGTRPSKITLPRQTEQSPPLWTSGEARYKNTRTSPCAGDQFAMPSLCAVAAPGEDFGVSRPARDLSELGGQNCDATRTAGPTPPKRLRRLERRKSKRDCGRKPDQWSLVRVATPPRRAEVPRVRDEGGSPAKASISDSSVERSPRRIFDWAGCSVYPPRRANAFGVGRFGASTPARNLLRTAPHARGGIPNGGCGRKPDYESGGTSIAFRRVHK